MSHTAVDAATETSHVEANGVAHPSDPAASRLYKVSLQSVCSFLHPHVLQYTAARISRLWRAAAIASREAESVRIARLTAKIRSGLLGSDEEDQASAAKDLLGLIGDALFQPRFPAVVDAAVVSKLVALLQSPNVSLVCSCVRLLDAIVMGPLRLGSAAALKVRIQMIAEQGAVPPLVRLLGSSNVKLQVPAVFALSQIARENSDWRDQILAAGAVPLILRLNSDTSSSLPLGAALLIAGLTSGKSTLDRLVSDGVRTPPKSACHGASDLNFDRERMERDHLSGIEVLSSDGPQSREQRFSGLTRAPHIRRAQVEAVVGSRVVAREESERVDVDLAQSRTERIVLRDAHSGELSRRAAALPQTVGERIRGADRDQVGNLLQTTTLGSEGRATRTMVRVRLAMTHLARGRVALKHRSRILIEALRSRRAAQIE